MNNADKPINAIIDQNNLRQALICSEEGLSKREHASIEAMKAILNNQNIIDVLMGEIGKSDSHYLSLMTNRIAMLATDYADEILLQLETK